MTVHKIADVKFQQTAERGLPSSAAPLVCTCGWEGVSGTFDAHRGATQTQTRVARAHAAWQARERAA